jgi:hypothetical protein
MAPDAGAAEFIPVELDGPAALPALAVACIPDAESDLIGPGIAIDETAQLKHGDASTGTRPRAWRRSTPGAPGR